MISSNSYITYKSYSDRECLNELLTEIIDIVLIQRHMTNLDGCDVLKMIKDNSKISHTPVIFISDLDDSVESSIKAYNCGAFDVVYKPFSKEILLHKIRMLYEFSSTRRELEEQIKVLTKLNEQNLEMRKQIEQIASIDYLTEVANRRIIDRELSKEYINSLQDGKPLALLMMDLDNFKMYNDYYGHQRGDRALRDIAKESKKAIKNHPGLIGRYGGEEFLIVLSDADKHVAEAVASKIIKNIDSLNIKHSTVCERNNLTVSIGIVSLIPNNKISIGKIINMADEALYDAKSQGKNTYAFKK